MTESKRVLFEVMEVADKLVSGYIRKSDDEVYGVSIPRFMCPDIDCIPGGSFYIQIETVDPTEEQKELARIFKRLLQ
ncbi:MAG: hypothetical protein A3B86_01135 [Candidatus Yanofskybacteria bacterium RIFCSPHIGHO2_02_FULL_38_22b]|uniref:DUF3006 domain-containing protein n=1 Tax=Candidatus Yanofskybacteria bacterium RIFCSPHIGHO2_02_FULL_38_22b TaxID=1802673 RepID=A0A1F8F2J0_9BACT|nr:MAG: hypothetical protein A3B86_01135 [Candidatus Yanofskybacteria bacterium RIFCSPHIGHO2_02_FULL_38_22b]OGN20396.1 MAG: hypothetical protein A2910_01485 [Candidatus Yanofskybacteria bacterium RIFCSPLOWO2_01_FULL_39_28]